MTKVIDSEHGLSIDLDEALILMNHMAELIKGYNGVFESIASMCDPTAIYKHKSGAYVIKHLQDKLIAGLKLVRDDQMRIFDKTGQVILDKQRVKGLIIKLNDLIALSHADAEKVKMERMMEMVTATPDKYSNMVIGDVVSGEGTVEIDDVKLHEDIVKGPIANNTGEPTDKDLIDQINRNYSEAGLKVPK